MRSEHLRASANALEKEAAKLRQWADELDGLEGASVADAVDTAVERLTAKRVNGELITAKDAAPLFEVTRRGMLLHAVPRRGVKVGEPALTRRVPGLGLCVSVFGGLVKVDDLRKELGWNPPTAEAAPTSQSDAGALL